MLGRGVGQNVWGKNALFRMFSTNYDVAIIGGGPGGYVAAIRAAQHGLSTVCVEKRGALGGTCLNVGCIPSKALLNISHKYEEAKHAKDIGINLGSVSYDWAKILEKKSGVVNGFTKGIEGLFRKNKVAYKIGTGSLGGNGLVNIAGNDGKAESFNAKHIIIATGSEVTPFPGINIDEKVFISSTGALSLEKVPETMIVIGAGVIGLELGSVYARFGTKVQVVEFMDRVCPSMDTDMGQLFQRTLSDQGLKFKFNTKVTKGEIRNGKAVLTVVPKDGGPEETITADACLVAIGRRPYTQNLGLDKAGVKVDAKGRIDINDHFQTNVKGVYAIGDVVSGPMLAHKAEDEGITLADLLAGKEGHINYNTIPSVVYTHPEVAWVGKTEEELKKEGIL